MDGVVNAAVTISGGRIICTHAKRELPNYGVFDERRYFKSGDGGPLLKISDAIVGVSVCEDIWVQNSIVDEQGKAGANLFVNLSSSPYRLGAVDERTRIASRWSTTHATPMVYCNLVGGQDELVFDGGSFVTNLHGEMVARAASFKEELLTMDIPLVSQETTLDDAREIKIEDTDKPILDSPALTPPLNEDEEVYSALRLGLSDYVSKNGFKGVVIALSGGVDSALTTMIATDALGADMVHVVTMPSPYSSEGSISDSVKMASNLGINILNLPIGSLMDCFDNTLHDVFDNRETDVTEENIQARIRGNLVMALSNKFGWLALATGNKSEMAVGYCTLYGDMVGGFAVIKDLFKNRVYRLCRWRNHQARKDIIPSNIIDKAPSAELRPDQFDTDSLPPYDILDSILSSYIEKQMGIDEIVKLGYKRDLVLRVVTMVDRAEYKRRQGPIGVKITPKAFGRDRRLPITCGFTD
jgi:NAD+ synthase (glutamine-hydrolysing)